ncbi:MAG: glutamate 5-kinase [Candidatus Omnitrophota bacterium]
MKKKKLKRITVKVGTRVLTDKNNSLVRKVIRDLSRQVSDLMDRKIEVILVSSGAITAGLGLLKSQKRGKSLSEIQAAASIGQSRLMHIYNTCFTRRGYKAGQILLTQEDFNDRARFLNISQTLNALFKCSGVPIINENDSVATEEIKCGDNDRLSSLVADLSDSDMLIILTDVQGLYDQNGVLIKRVESVTPEIKALSRGKGCDESSGGMSTKLEAMETAAQAGIQGIIAKGRRKNVLIDIVQGLDVGTRFESREKPLKAKKRWIAFSLKARGAIIVDEGAARALVDKQKSLLPSGIKEAHGKFRAGDVVEILDGNKKIIARGLTNYSADEIEKIKGQKCDTIEKQLGYKDYDEVVHRDNLVVINI